MRIPFDFVGQRSVIAISLGIFLMLALTLGVSWPALNGPFLFDDFPNLEHLATLGGQLDWASLANYSSLYASEPGRPLSMLSFVINDFDWPTDARPFKYTNLMFHLLIGVLLFGLARSLCRTSHANSRKADLVALLAMSAWLLHPIQLSTTMLVVQRMTQLSVLFTVAGLWGYVVLSARAQKPITALAAIAVLGSSTILAVLCKETGALTPLLAVVLNTTLLRERLDGLPIPSRRILTLGTLVPVLALIAGIIARWDALTYYGSRPFDLGERLLSQSRALCEYLFHILVPSLRGGGLYHDDFAISRGLMTPWTTLPAVLFVVALIIGAIFSVRRRPILAFALLWFFCAHALESTVFPLELYFEHRNYLPMFGILFALAIWVVEGKSRGRAWVMPLACLWLAFASWLTYVQAPIWGNRSALVAVWAIEHPDSPRAVQQQAADYYLRGQADQAANTLLDAYARGVRGADFPSQVLLLACLRHDPALASRASPLISESLASGEYARALPITMRKIRLQVQANTCPEMISADRWLAMTDQLLANSYYSDGQSGAYLRVERSNYYRSLGDLNATMIELEKAWAATPTPQVAQLIAATLVSAGLLDQAEEWAHRALNSRTRGVRGLFAQDDVRSKSMIKAIEARKNDVRSHPEP